MSWRWLTKASNILFWNIVDSLSLESRDLKNLYCPNWCYFSHSVCNHNYHWSTKYFFRYPSLLEKFHGENVIHRQQVGQHINSFWLNTNVYMSARLPWPESYQVLKKDKKLWRTSLETPVDFIFVNWIDSKSFICNNRNFANLCTAYRVFYIVSSLFQGDQLVRSVISSKLKHQILNSLRQSKVLLIDFLMLFSLQHLWGWCCFCRHSTLHAVTL